MNNVVKHNCTQELKDADLKITPARLGVLEALENSNEPIDIQSIASYLKKHKIKADKVTVFRIINALKEKGLARPVQLNEGWLRYEHSLSADHHHFICEKCSSVEDISDCHIDQLEKEINNKKGLLVKRHSLEFFGLCKSCQL